MPHKYSICRKGIAQHLEHLPMGSISKPGVTVLLFVNIYN